MKPEFNLYLHNFGNVAVEGRENEVLADMLRDIAAKIEQCDDSGVCFDDNGNRIGVWDVTIPETA